MANLFANISKILSPKVRLELYTPLNQHLLDSPNIILWNEESQVIDDDTYKKLTEAIQRKSCTFYNLSKVLPYQDFCIALLCSVEYSLNQNTAPQIHSKTYLSAWRTMTVIADTGEDNVKDWIKARLNDRSSFGYSTALGVNMQNTTNTVRRSFSGKELNKFALDQDRLTKACSSGKIRNIFKDTPDIVRPIVFESTATPEGQLDSLRLIHKTLLSKTF